MKQNEKPVTSSASSATTEGVSKPAPKKPAQGESPAANNLGKGIDRPGFDLGGSTGETHAGTGLGLGTDAFDTGGDRSLPGRKLDNPRTIPRWGGPEPHESTVSARKTGKSHKPKAIGKGT